MILYGIPTCDTCRKALAQIRAAGLPVSFRDIRAAPLAADEIAGLLAALGPGLVNRASATWRGLDAAAREGDAAALLAAHPALMKRPVIRRGGQVTMGWTPEVKSLILK